MTEDNKVKKNDFIELKYTGYSNNQVFDSNIEKDLKKMNSDNPAQKIIVIARIIVFLQPVGRGRNILHPSIFPAWLKKFQGI